MDAARPPPRTPTHRSRVPAWMLSPRLLLPLALIVALVLLGSFASVVQGIVRQGELGNGVSAAPPSPGVDRV